MLFSGFESSGGIVVMLNLLGGTASYAFNVTVTLSSSSASGKIANMKSDYVCSYVILKTIIFDIIRTLSTKISAVSTKPLWFYTFYSSNFWL